MDQDILTTSVALRIPRASLATCSRNCGCGDSRWLRRIRIHHLVLLSSMGSIRSHGRNRRKSARWNLDATATPLAGGVVIAAASVAAAPAPGSAKVAGGHLTGFETVEEWLEVRNAGGHDAHAQNDLVDDGWWPHVKHGVG